MSVLRATKADFSTLSQARWYARRFFLGLYLMLVFSQVSMFVVQIDGSLPKSLFGRLIVEQSPIISMWGFGMMGSLLNMMHVFVASNLKHDYTVSWYIVRPYIGALLGVFLYFAARAGQIVFYSGKNTVDPSDINVNTLAFLAIIAGLFPEEAFSSLRQIAFRTLKNKDDDA